MMHVLMDWTVGTFGTVRNEFRRTGLMGTLGTLERSRPGGFFFAALWGEDSVTHEACSHGLDCGDSDLRNYFRCLDCLGTLDS